MKYVITGGAGFIGSNIVEELVSQGQEVVVIDNFSTGKKENLREFEKNIRIVEGSISDIELLKKEFQGADFVLHQAAIPSVPRSVKDPLSSNNANITGTLNVLIAARDCGVKKVVAASSSSVYGESEKLPKTEDMPTHAISPYGLTKLAGEEYMRLFFELYGLNYCALRYFNVFGPKQDPKSDYAAVIPLFIRKILSNEQPGIFGDGEQTRDFTFVKNVVEANLLAAKSSSVGVFNIACGERISVNRLVQGINSILGKSIKPKYLEERKGDIKHSMAGIEKARKMLGFNPKVSFTDGLNATVDWYMNAI